MKIANCEVYRDAPSGEGVRLPTGEFLPSGPFDCDLDVVNCLQEMGCEVRALAEHESRPTLPAPEPKKIDGPNGVPRFKLDFEVPIGDDSFANGKYHSRDVADAMQSYLSSNVAMLMFSKLTLYRATGENPRVVVSYKGSKFRVHIERSNGQKEHFNRDGEP